MGMGQYLWIPYFSGMNIHLPAILMWTTGVQGFDTLPYLTTFIIELDDGKIYRKALYLMVKTNGFPVKFPLNQSNDFNQETLNGIWATKVEVQHSWFYIIKNINIYSQKKGLWHSLSIRQIFSTIFWKQDWPTAIISNWVQDFATVSSYNPERFPFQAPGNNERWLRYTQITWSGECSWSSQILIPYQEFVGIAMMVPGRSSGQL